jgi:hypothetical protein
VLLQRLRQQHVLLKEEGEEASRLVVVYCDVRNLEVTSKSLFDVPPLSSKDTFRFVKGVSDDRDDDIAWNISLVSPADFLNLPLEGGGPSEQRIDDTTFVVMIDV